MSFWTKKSEPEVDQKKSSTPVESVTKVTTAPQVPSPVAAAPQAGAAEKPTGNPIEDNLTARYGKVRSALGPGTVIQGKLSFDTPVRMDGKLSGEVYSSRALIVGPSGSVEADIEVAALVVLGRVKGNVRATERVEILAGGSVEGDLQAPVFVVEEGGRFDGHCKPSNQKSSITGIEKREPTAKPVDKPIEKAADKNSRSSAAASGVHSAPSAT